jgi:hypothetical protein
VFPLEVWAYDDGEIRGFFPSADRHVLLEQHVWKTFVAGLWYTEDAPLSDAFAPGRPLSLLSDPDNPFDPNAVGVMDADATIRAAWLPAGVAECLDETHRVGMSLMEFIEDRRLGLLIAVSREPLELVVHPEAPSPSQCDVIQRYMHKIRRAEPIPDEQQEPRPDPVDAMWRMLAGET